MDVQLRKGYEGAVGGRSSRKGRGKFRSREKGGGRGSAGSSGRGRGRGEIGAGGEDWGHSSKGCGKQHGNGKRAPFEIPEDERDPLKLYVGNLRKSVNKYQLLLTLTQHANVTSVFIVQTGSKYPNYGFVSCQTEDDVNKIIDLGFQNHYLCGSKLIFGHSRKHFPGDKGFVLQPLPDRDYDLRPVDPNKPSFHVLVDDVILKILSYVPLKERILCEVVCCRWQALIYVMFKSTTHMNLNEHFLIQNTVYINKAMFSKMLLLTGATLKSLSISEADITLRKKIFLMIAQLCPNLEFLNMSNVPILCFENIKLLKNCNNLKCFFAENCLHFVENSLKELLSVLPCLEKINISQTNITGHCFNLLPEGLKELNISFCSQVSKENLRKVSKACKHLEVLEMERLIVDKELLEELGVNCTNLKSLKLYIPHWYSDDVSNQVKNFSKLINLKILAPTFNLFNIADDLKVLEELYIQINQVTMHMVDFGKFTCLKKVSLLFSPFHDEELMSLEKCKNLQYVTIIGCDDKPDNETIKRIVKCCPEIKKIRCPEVGIDIKFITDINEIMKNRSEKIEILLSKGFNPNDSELLEAQYDSNKIDFCFVDHSFFASYLDDDLTDDYDDSDEDFYDSDDSYDMDNGYDSDDSLPDYALHRDYLDMLYVALNFFNVGLQNEGNDSDASL